MVNWLKGSLIGTYVCKFREIIGLAPPTEDLPLDISPEYVDVDLSVVIYFSEWNLLITYKFQL